MTRILTWLVALAGVLAAADPPAPQFSLPDGAQPRAYAIDLKLSPGADTFRGVAAIDLELQRSTAFLWLNGRDLVVESATFSGMPARVVAAGGEFLGFDVRRAVGPGAARLEVRYRGRIGRNPTGIFHSRSAGDWYLFTTFTAIEARRAFPCFDEPRYKARWELTLHIARENTALANTRVVSETVEPGGKKRVVFARTEPLPSSLVAFAVGPFEIVDAGTAGKNGTPIRVVTPRGRGSEAAAARAAAPQLLAKLEDYTGIPYPFDKLDHLALIEGAFGAIENPGLITYRQRALLIRPDTDSAQSRRQMRSTMAHELAHQWFGNLVTMADWQDIWLSEGFATWMAAKIMDGEQPAEQRGLLPAVARDRIMGLDGSGDSRRVREPIVSRAAMRNVYSAVVYEKGAATLAMLEHWVGDAPFRDAVRRYLAEHRFANATTDDFLSAIHASSGRDAGPEMRSFFDQAGVPVITAEIRCGSGRSTIVLRQDRYFPLGSHGAAVQTWNLPVCIKGEGLAEKCLVMDAPEAEVSVPACPSWVFTNAGASGYYRSLFGPELLATLSRQRDRLTAAERLVFAQDVSALVRNARLPAGAALGLLRWMEKDSEPLVVREAADLADMLAPLVPVSLKQRFDRILRIEPAAAGPMRPRELELFRAAQQKSLIEFLSRQR